MTASINIPLNALVKLQRHPGPSAVFHIASRQRAERWIVRPLPDPYLNLLIRGGQWATPLEKCGDASGNYHPKYLMAVLSSSALEVKEEGSPTPRPTLSHWPIPTISFTTEEFVRRSMTLNGMRMSTEYFETGSWRILQLVEQRLAVGQSDVVHDVLVYLMQHILDRREHEREARLLRAEAVAAYLGLQQERVNHLFLTTRLTPQQITQQINDGYAGPVRRSLDVLALIRSQLHHLRPALRQYQQEEDQALELLDMVLCRLRQSR